MKYVVTLNGTDYEVDVTELSEAIVTNVAPTAPVAPVAAAPVAAPAPAAAPAKPLAPGSAGELKMYDVEPKTAAMIMAIVADKLQKPLNELRFISIKEVK